MYYFLIFEALKNITFLEVSAIKEHLSLRTVRRNCLQELLYWTSVFKSGVPLKVEGLLNSK